MSFLALVGRTTASRTVGQLLAVYLVPRDSRTPALFQSVGWK